ncbi:hypothetical protein [Streptomyces sp. NPDC056061]|uniref:hypothetical protein n=1 Tax=Streptomyces sp. NPDC056061 TaxID=3345700 RepID=UPI0035DFD419
MRASAPEAPASTAIRTEGIAGQLRLHSTVKAGAGEGYRGLANEFPSPDHSHAPLTERHGWREMRRRQSSRRICVEHANAEPLQRYTGRREDYGDRRRAIAGPVCRQACHPA